jgi:phosphoribosylformylglycinamidine synthase subunit PurS
VTRVVVTVMPRAGVLDPQGQTVQGALSRLGFGGVGDVRVGKRIELDLEGDDPRALAERAREMADRLLANPLIEDYRVEVEG